jgi:hypothetical protein
LVKKLKRRDVVKIIDEVKIGGEILPLFLDAEWIGSHTETIRTVMGIRILKTEEGSITRKLAEKIAQKHEVMLTTKNFGGVSSDDPPRYGNVFKVFLKHEYERYYTDESKTEETEKEMSEARKKLIVAVTELYQKIDKLVEFTMHL